MDWGYIADNTDKIAERFVEHLLLTVVAIVVGFIIAFPLAIYAYRHRWFYGPVAGATGILYTIPSLALFALLTPYTGLTFKTAEIALVGYTLLILIRNTVAGLDGVPDDARDAAIGMGYSNRQLLWRVEIPLALPVIMAGVRIATVTTIGLVTVTALIGLGGLGYFILVGLRAFGANNTAAILGAVLSIALAVFVDGLFVLLQRWLTPWSRRRQQLAG
jgi:osmoprotectant transport system permease protein